MFWGKNKKINNTHANIKVGFNGVQCIYRGYLLFEVNTKYISSSELKTSEFSRARSTSEIFYVFNSRDEIYLVFTENKSKFSFYLIQYTGVFQFTRQAVKMFFGTTLFLRF